jgi:hypothetical protein
MITPKMKPPHAPGRPSSALHLRHLPDMDSCVRNQKPINEAGRMNVIFTKMVISNRLDLVA